MNPNTDFTFDNSALPAHIVIKIAVVAEYAKPEKKELLGPLQAVGSTQSDLGGGDKKAIVMVLKDGNEALQKVADSKVYKAYKTLLKAALKPQGYGIGLDGHPKLLLENAKAAE